MHWKLVRNLAKWTPGGRADLAEGNREATALVGEGTWRG